MRKLLSVFTFFAVAPLVLLVSIVFFSYRNYENQNVIGMFLRHSKIAFSIIPNGNNLISTQINFNDSREARIYLFLNNYKSPLAAYSHEFVTAADKYKIDWELLPAIALTESGGCKTAPKNSYNCWGFGIYTHKTTKFDSYADAIDSIARQISQNYYSHGLTTPETISKIYNPATPDGWASHVEYFKNQI